MSPKSSLDVSTTAHTVSNLLTSLNLSSSQLLYQNDQQTIEKYVKQTDATIQSAISAIQYMTILDKLERGKIKPSFVQTDITKLILRTIDSKRLKWGNVILNLHGSRIIKSTDSFFLEIVMNELLDNSCRYKSASVNISIDSVGDNTRIAVKDDGEGIESDELAKVFEPYFRIKKHRERSNRAGLGLTTVKAISHKLEGHIKLNSSPQWGTRAEIYL